MLKSQGAYEKMLANAYYIFQLENNRNSNHYHFYHYVAWIVFGTLKSFGMKTCSIYQSE